MLWTLWSLGFVELKHFWGPVRNYVHITTHSTWRNEEQIHVLSPGLTLELHWNYFHMSLLCRALINYAVLGQMLLCMYWHYTGMLHGMCTVQGRPSTVVSLKDWPTVKETWVVRTLVDVLMDRLSPCWVISTAGLEAAVTAIFLRKIFTPVHTQTELTLYKITVVTKVLSAYSPNNQSLKAYYTLL